ncbi:SAM-dependent methyltransferase [Bisbaumannia pacifica]|uniref:SAM-dependent methyltransferase n=1 Tax=Bisbaumannia pacifica TaxID=77098 RepID=A0A510X9B8_9GAMM|nr:DUF938 domain-containing protein [Halomonas pacifica]GEK47277.1 SAM-dependent methyltransferase [Halomonas pacifica]
MDSLDPDLGPGAEARLISPAAARNAAPILAVLRDVLPSQGRVLELASGSGEHALHFARALPGLEWQPSDPSPRARASIAAWRDAEGPDNLLAPIALDVTHRPWPVADFAALVCINLLHISPWAAGQALFAEAGARLPAGGVCFVYGPFQRDGAHTAPSNAAFDADLRRRDPAWGIRDLAAVEAEARRQGLVLSRVVEMPANNLSLVFQRS